MQCRCAAAAAVALAASLFSFIILQEAYAEYGQDVFCHGTYLEDKQLQDEVTFELGLNESGQPQALKVQATGNRGGGKAPAGTGQWSRARW